MGKRVVAKYRPVDTRVWDDRKFLSLSNDARLLWMHLLTSPNALPIPGVIVAGPASISERLGWPVEQFGKRFAEVQQSGLAVSREGTLVWLRNATKYQPPANPNMVIGWSKCWDDVPEGSLKHDIWQALKIACKGWSRIFEKRFPEPLLKPFANGSVNGFIQEQEQDQEQKQEQDQEQDLVPPAAAQQPLALFRAKVEAAAPKPRKHPLPEDWEPRDHERALALRLGVDCDKAAVRFRNHQAQNGTRGLAWDQAFNNWLRGAKDMKQDLLSSGSGFAAVLAIASGEES